MIRGPRKKAKRRRTLEESTKLNNCLIIDGPVIFNTNEIHIPVQEFPMKKNGRSKSFKASEMSDSEIANPRTPEVALSYFASPPPTNNDPTAAELKQVRGF